MARTYWACCVRMRVRGLAVIAEKNALAVIAEKNALAVIAEKNASQ